MKKFYRIILFCLPMALICAACFNPLTAAADEGGGDYGESESAESYEPVYDMDGGTMYLVIPTVDVDEYNPPFYQISADSLFISKEQREIRRRVTFRYNRNKQTIYLKGTDNKWYWLDYNESEISAKELLLAERMFFLCYQIPFGTQN